MVVVTSDDNDNDIETGDGHVYGHDYDPDGTPPEVTEEDVSDINPHVTLTYKCTLGAHKEGELSLSLPMKSLKMTEKLLKQLGDHDQAESEGYTAWLKCFNEAKEAFIPGGSLYKTLHADDSTWNQDVDHETSKIGIMQGKPLDTKSSGNITGNDALLRLNDALNLGGIVRIPLWHSGIWVTLKAPNSRKLITIDRLLANEKIILGRQTNGMIYSNVSVYLRKTLMELVLDSITDTSLGDYNRESLLDIIRITDYNVLLWGITCAIYPDGYNISQPCVADITKCQNIVEERVALSKISWVNTAALSSEQREFIWQSLSTKRTKEEILDYQGSLECNSEHKIPVNDLFGIYLKVPSIREDLESGVKWVDSVVSSVEETFEGLDENDNLKNIRISEQARASTLRQYVSWISKCEIIECVSTSSPSPAYITDRSTIEAACESMTSSADACDTIFKAIGNFIDQSTINVIGLPSYDCPNCGESNNPELSSHPDIIPIAIDEIFFILIRHWTIRVVTQDATF